MRLALVEKTMAEPDPAIRRQQYRLAEIEDLADRHAALAERLLEGLAILRQRNAGRCADHFVAVESQHEDAVRGFGIGLQVFSLEVLVAVVQVGEVAEHGDAQARDVRQVRDHLFATEHGDAHCGSRGREDIHAETWSIQSCRL